MAISPESLNTQCLCHVVSFYPCGFAVVYAELTVVVWLGAEGHQHQREEGDEQRRHGGEVAQRAQVVQLVGQQHLPTAERGEEQGQ